MLRHLQRYVVLHGIVMNCDYCHGVWNIDTEHRYGAANMEHRYGTWSIDMEQRYGAANMEHGVQNKD